MIMFIEQFSILYMNMLFTDEHFRTTVVYAIRETGWGVKQFNMRKSYL